MINSIQLPNQPSSSLPREHLSGEIQNNLNQTKTQETQIWAPPKNTNLGPGIPKLVTGHPNLSTSHPNLSTGNPNWGKETQIGERKPKLGRGNPNWEEETQIG